MEIMNRMGVVPGADGDMEDMGKMQLDNATPVVSYGDMDDVPDAAYKSPPPVKGDKGSAMMSPMEDFVFEKDNLVKPTTSQMMKPTATSQPQIMGMEPTKGDIPQMKDTDGPVPPMDFSKDTIDMGSMSMSPDTGLMGEDVPTHDNSDAGRDG